MAVTAGIAQSLYPGFLITDLRQDCPESFWFSVETDLCGYAQCMPACLLFSSLTLIPSPQSPKYFQLKGCFASPLCTPGVQQALCVKTVWVGLSQWWQELQDAPRSC